MTWNYRIVKSKWKLKKLKGINYSIREVYYNEKGKPVSWSAEPQTLCSESIGDLVSDIISIGLSFGRTVLEERGNKLVEVKK